MFSIILMALVSLAVLVMVFAAFSVFYGGCIFITYLRWKLKEQNEKYDWRSLK